MNTAFVRAKKAIPPQRGALRLVSDSTWQNDPIELIKNALMYEPGDDLVRSGWYHLARAFLKRTGRR
jgi:hypothetical protein